MKRIFYILFAIIFVTGCSLNSEQEMALSRDVKALFDARNTGDALMYLGLTHPSVVKHYQSLGNDAILQRFQEVTPTTEQSYDQWYYQREDEVYWKTHLQKDIIQQDELIQVKMEVKLERDFSTLDSTIMIYALSKDNGYNWLFVEERDYYADYFPPEHRLFQ